MIKRLFLFFLLFCIPIAHAEAPAPGDKCLTYDGAYESAPLFRVKTLNPSQKAYFYQKARACPEQGACAWRGKSYLVDGDTVLGSAEANGFRCVYYGIARGALIAGFLPNNLLEPIAREETQLSKDFLKGLWTFDLSAIPSKSGVSPNHISFTVASDEKKIQAEGMASWDGGNSNIHEGYFKGSSEIKGEMLRFTDGSEGCEVTVKRRGPYLVVADNDQCGGMNVSFNGIYVRKASPRVKAQ